MIKLPLPKVIGSEVEIGFSHLVKAAEKENQEINISDEDSDNAGEEIKGKTFLDYDGTIENIYYSRYSAPYGFVALMSDSKFSIRYIYEEATSGCEHDTKFNCNYRFDKQMRKYGKHLCADFDDEGRSLVTGTNIGWICCWSIET